MSVGSAAPWAPSLAELSSEDGNSWLMQSRSAWLCASCCAGPVRPLPCQQANGPHPPCASAAADGLGLPAGSTTSQVASPSGGSRFFGRRSGHKRLSSGTWPWQPGAGGAPGPSASSNHLGQPERASGSEARPAALSQFAPLARLSPVRRHGPGDPGSDAQHMQRTSVDGSHQQAQQAQQQAVMQVVLSIKVMVSAGTVCAFHIGGGQESADDTGSIPVGGTWCC